MRFKLFNFGVLAAFALCVTGQAEPRVAKAIAVTKSSASPGALPEAGSVLLRSNDLFDLRLSGMPEEDSRQFGGAPYNVGSDGTVSFPLIGRVQAAGLTPNQLERAIEKKLVDDKIFRWPNATVNVVTSARFVTVGGNVRGPQRMAWSADLTLLSAISTAGGVGEFGGDKVTLTRNAKVNQFSIKKLKKDPTLDPKLLPADQIEVL